MAKKLLKWLHYINDTIPGISRKKRGKSFIYLAPDGTQITDEVILERIKSLAIPPAYSRVWICPLANGHLQATERDSKNRKPRFCNLTHLHSFYQRLISYN